MQLFSYFSSIQYCWHSTELSKKKKINDKWSINFFSQNHWKKFLKRYFIIYRECPKLFTGVQTGFTIVNVSNIIFFFFFFNYTIHKRTHSSGLNLNHDVYVCDGIVNLKKIHKLNLIRIVNEEVDKSGPAKIIFKLRKIIISEFIYGHCWF